MGKKVGPKCSLLKELCIAFESEEQESSSHKRGAFGGKHRHPLFAHLPNALESPRISIFSLLLLLGVPDSTRLNFWTQFLGLNFW